MFPTLRKVPGRLHTFASGLRLLGRGKREDTGDVVPPGRLRRFRAYLAAQELSAILEQSGTKGKRMLDIGGAYGIHASFFRERHPDLQVDLLDLLPGPAPLVHTGPYETFETEQPYDIIWASHVVEHLRNPGLFFDQARRQLAMGGWLCVTVPPLRSRMTMGHVTLWNAGLLLLHLVHAGFDCRQARVASYGYNVSVLVQKRGQTKLSKRQMLPQVRRRGIYFEGEIQRLNWSVDQVDPIYPGDRFQSARRVASKLSRSGFFQALDDSGKYGMHYFHAPTGEHWRLC